jgi:hypothetical protein
MQRHCRTDVAFRWLAANAAPVRIPGVFVRAFRLNPYTDSGVFVHPSEAVV